MRSRTGDSVLLRWMLRTIAIIVVVSGVAGIFAVAVGGFMNELGSGPGGLYGIPSLLLTLVALGVGTPAAISTGRLLRGHQGWLVHALLAFLGVWVVALGYFIVAHIVDPCLNGWWDEDSRIGSQRLCERYGSELNWHPRLHLLAHAGPATALLAAYLWALRWHSNRLIAPRG